jgi:hypothetical protein
MQIIQFWRRLCCIPAEIRGSEIAARLSRRTPRAVPGCTMSSSPTRESGGGSRLSSVELACVRRYPTGLTSAAASSA